MVAVASCRRADDCNVRREARSGVRAGVWRKTRIEGARSREAMVVGMNEKVRVLVVKV